METEDESQQVDQTLRGDKCLQNWAQPGSDPILLGLQRFPRFFKKYSDLLTRVFVDADEQRVEEDVDQVILIGELGQQEVLIDFW